MSEASSNPSYLGLDLSTQQLKAIVVDDNLTVLHETSVQFDNDLPEFRTYGGVLQKKETPHVVVAPCLMWVKALDMILDKLRVCGVDFSRVVAISGCAQQHGTVYWNKGSGRRLRSLNPDKFLHEQLATSFSSSLSPIWMDSSTSEFCKSLEDTIGGARKLAEITGSRAYERFSGPQIAKMSRDKPDAYNNTERICLISSFAASLFLGDFAPIDWSDGSGTNLFDIREKDWNDRLLEACAPRLREKLGKTVPSYTNIGPVSPYFVERFGFNEKCRIVAFTGDNPGSLIGMRLKAGDIACSLGTSDTLFLWLNEPRTEPEGHVFCNPLEAEAYMALLCFKNGSLTRERIRDSAAGGSWQLFNELLDSTPRGNFGNVGLYFDTREILPPLLGDYRFNKGNDEIGRYSSKEVEVRALVEGQFVAKRAHAEDFGLTIGPNTRIIATGGASANKAILQVLSDVFASPVYTSEIVNSAVLGAAYQAKHGLLRDKCTFAEITSCLPEARLACRPYDDAESKGPAYAPHSTALRERNTLSVHHPKPTESKYLTRGADQLGVTDSAQIYKPLVARYRKIVEQLLPGNEDSK